MKRLCQVLVEKLKHELRKYLSCPQPIIRRQRKFLSIDGNSPNRYQAYFENAQGEQLIFIYDREADTSTLYHGDAGWDHPCLVEDGMCPELVLDEAETLWLRVCWLAATELHRRSE